MPSPERLHLYTPLESQSQAGAYLPQRLSPERLSPFQGAALCSAPSAPSPHGTFGNSGRGSPLAAAPISTLDGKEWAEAFQRQAKKEGLTEKDAEHLAAISIGSDNDIEPLPWDSPSQEPGAPTERDAYGPWASSPTLRRTYPYAADGAPQKKKTSKALGPRFCAAEERAGSR